MLLLAPNLDEIIPLIGFISATPKAVLLKSTFADVFILPFEVLIFGFAKTYGFST